MSRRLPGKKVEKVFQARAKALRQVNGGDKVGVMRWQREPRLERPAWSRSCWVLKTTSRI